MDSATDVDDGALAATSQNSMAWDVAAIAYGQLRFGAVLSDPRLFPGR